MSIQNIMFQSPKHTVLQSKNVILVFQILQRADCQEFTKHVQKLHKNSRQPLRNPTGDSPEFEITIFCGKQVIRPRCQNVTSCAVFPTLCHTPPTHIPYGYLHRKKTSAAITNKVRQQISGRQQRQQRQRGQRAKYDMMVTR